MKRINVRLITLAVVAIAATAMTAKAGVIDLTFEGLAPYPQSLAGCGKKTR